MSRFFLSNWPWLATLVDVALALAVTVHVVLWKRDTRAAIAWAGLAWLAPIVGALAYFYFGVNRIQRHAVALKGSKDDSLHPPHQIESRTSPILAERFTALNGLAVLGDRLTRREVSEGNVVEPLINGDEAFPIMLDAIGKAEKSVSLLSYIFDHDRAGEAFFKALLDAHRRGVKVRILLDDVGSRYSRPNMIHVMHKAGLPVRGFLTTKIYHFSRYTNLRNHRKILVVDGRIGFTGGTNIREGHWLSLNPAVPVQCLHFRLDGPVVASLQETFAADWDFAAGEELSGDLWFPKIQASGPIWARGIAHGPDEDFEKMVDVFIGALSIARNRVRIITPYFLPDSSLIKALGVAAMRGVDVEILLPSRSNIRLVQWAATAQLWQLIEKGCRIYYTPPPFDHTKLMIVDDAWTLIGSTNWDPRSLRLNFEFNVECYDETFAQKLNGIVDAKLSQAREITLHEINSRPIAQKLRDGLARLASPYL